MSDSIIINKILNLNQVIREGSDITLVGWGAQLSIMEQACVEAEKVSHVPHDPVHHGSFYTL